MTIETGIENAGVYIDTLDDTYPASGDDLVEGDNHIRGIKNCILNTFPAITGAVTSTHTELNLLDGVTATTAELNILDGVTATATEINYLDKASALGISEASKVVTTDANRDITNLNSVTSTAFVGDLTGDVTGNADTATAVAAGAIVEASLAAPLGVPILLQEQTASGSSSIDFVNGIGGCVIDTTYDHYILEISALVPATTSTSLRVRFSTDTGSSWIVINYHDGATPSAAHITVATSITTTSANALSGELHFIGLTTGTHYRHMYGDVIHFNGSGALEKNDPWGGLIGTTAVDGIRLIMSSGNIASGTFRLYGIHK